MLLNLWRGWLTSLSGLFLDFMGYSISSRRKFLDGGQQNKKQKRLLLNVGCLCAFVILLVMGVLAWSAGVYALGTVDLVAACGLLVNLLALRKNGNYERAAGFALLLGGSLFYILFVSGGFNQTGHFWYFVFPMLSSFLLGAKYGTRATLLLFGATLLFFLVDHWLPFVHIYEAGFKIRFLAAFLLITIYTFLAEGYREDVLGRFQLSNLELVKKIDELEDTRNSLFESEDKYRSLVERANDGIIIVQDSKLRYINPQMAKMFGYKVAEVLDTDFADYLDNEVLEDVVVRHRERINGQKPVDRYETFVRHRQGKSIAVEFNSSLINYHRRPASLVVVRDISERKRSEIAQEKALLAAEAANRAKSEFLANMSHELRTPLNHIIGFASLLAQEKTGSLNATQKEYLADVMGSSEHLLETINDILDLAKIEAGKIELEYCRVETEVFLDSCLNMIKHKAFQHHLVISSEIKDDFPPIFIADERKLKQVFFNLLANAAKFSEDGGSVTLTAEVGADGKTLLFKVKDVGLGIAGHDLEKIFFPFEQADNSAARKYQGTGLGLSLSLKIVEEHGGTLTAESAGVGQGSTFSVSLPALKALPGRDGV